jgi:hypothetical protein
MPPNTNPQYPQQPQFPVQNPVVPSGPQLPSSKPPVGFILGLAITILLLVGALVFGFWAFGQMQDFKNNSDQKSATAVLAASEKQKKELDAQFAEQEKSPLKTYTSPNQFASIKIVYPKTWSAYVIEQTDGSNPLDGYFAPGFVPNIQGKNNYSLRLQYTSTPYTAVLQQYSAATQAGTVKVSAYTPEQVKGATPGVKLTGQLEPQKSGTMIILPIRDKTLKIWTETDSAQSDFNTVLKNLTFSP